MQINFNTNFIHVTPGEERDWIESMNVNAIHDLGHRISALVNNGEGDRFSMLIRTDETGRYHFKIDESIENGESSSISQIRIKSSDEHVCATTNLYVMNMSYQVQCRGSELTTIPLFALYFDNNGDIAMTISPSNVIAVYASSVTQLTSAQRLTFDPDVV